MNLIDLAGSESATVHKDTTAPARHEMLNINRSLLTLTSVISKLSDKSPQWIPYRDSKLTKYLESALQGNAKISIVCNISPGEDAYDQSQSTLSFALMAKNIKQTVQKNEANGGDKDMIITRLEEEVKSLKEKLQMVETEVPIGEKEKVKGKISRLLSKVITGSLIREIKEEPQEGKLPENFPARINQIAKTLQQQSKLEEIRMSTLMQALEETQLNNILNKNNTSALSDVVRPELPKEAQTAPELLNSKDEHIQTRTLNQQLNDLDELLKNDHPLNKESARDTMLLEDSKECGSILPVPEYLSSRATAVETSQTVKSLELKEILQHSEEALMEETIVELKKQLMEAEVDRQKLISENKEFVVAVSELTKLLESALGELKGYREKYGNLY
eukprot:TRINITY_DN12090_c0_g5_i2.p1 TRINITY_DN12090_c0_g5~~TRINITY_DN12090_c0_g5_i2.p1  ORF type:complete len:390 (+),score=139.53 TRINITY_DN12090_c0_g5_i2:577-1746(+)